MENKITGHSLWTSKNTERTGLPETELSEEVEKKAAAAFIKSVNTNQILRPFQTQFEESDLARLLG